MVFQVTVEVFLARRDLFQRSVYLVVKSRELRRRFLERIVDTALVRVHLINVTAPILHKDYMQDFDSRIAEVNCYFAEETHNEQHNNHFNPQITGGER